MNPTESRQLKIKQEISTFGAIKNKKIALGGKNSIVESKTSTIYD